VTPYDAFLFFWVFIIILVIAVWWGLKRMQPQSKRYISSPGGQQWELDIRLPYKRFKQLYPYSKMTYQEYKQAQMRTAFRKAVSSQKNKRMVR
jgi:hypothetical protein